MLHHNPFTFIILVNFSILINKKIHIKFCPPARTVALVSRSRFESPFNPREQKQRLERLTTSSRTSCQQKSVCPRASDRVYIAFSRWMWAIFLPSRHFNVSRALGGCSARVSAPWERDSVIQHRGKMALKRIQKVRGNYFEYKYMCDSLF